MRYFLLKISVIDSVPMIWRRVYVPSEITLDRLHDVIQIVMGWRNEQEYFFYVDDVKYSISSPKRNIEITRLSDLLTNKKHDIKYVYGSKAKWLHNIQIEEMNYSPSNKELLINCLGGERACPIEKINGIYNYMRFCEAMNDPYHEMRSEYINWYSNENEGKDHKPELFDIANVNEELRKFIIWSSDRFLNWKLNESSCRKMIV